MLKSQLVIELAMALKIINDRDEELRQVNAENSTLSKLRQDEQTETRRLRKVLDRAITAVDCRISTIRYEAIPVPSRLRETRSQCYHNESPMDYGTSPANIVITEEQKFLDFVKIGILHDQYKPEENDKFGDGFGGLYR